MTYTDRWDFIQPYVQGKRVLDIGPAELVGTLNRDKMDRWLHKKIAEVASETTGLEQSSEQVNTLRELGFDLRQGDAETFQLDAKFETVVAGELIEHLSNPGRFLSRVHDHLTEDGILVLTTPNRFSIQTIYKIVRSGRIPKYSKPLAKHVLYFDSDSITSLLERHGFGILELSYCQWVGERSDNWIMRALVALTARWRPVLSSTLMVSAKKDSS